MKNSVIASLITVLLLASFAGPVVAAPSAQGAHDFPIIKYEKYKLPNGLEVILSEDHRLPLVAVDV
jgi:zinc protease